MCSGCVNDARAGASGLGLQGIDHGNRFFGRVIMQAQDHHVCLCNQCTFGLRVFAQSGVDADELNLRHGLQAFADLQTCGAGFAVNKDFFHGVSKGQILDITLRGTGALTDPECTSCKPCTSIVRRSMIHSRVDVSSAVLASTLSLQHGEHSPVPKRDVMKIHEYQGKEILRQFGVPVPRGIPAFTVQEAVEAAQKLGGPVWVVKAQIHAGGRGKGGGVKVAKSIDDVKRLAGEILGMQLKTHQTGPEGQKVRRLYIEDGADIKNELYVSLVTDRATQKVALIASSEGGMDIEEVAHSTPEKIITEMIDPLTGITTEQSKKVAQAIGLTGGSVDQAVDIFAKLYKCYMDTDASLVEINPLNCDSKGDVMALDAKFNFDSNALFRHPEIVAYRDLDEEDAAEVEASKFDLAYISLDGNIGCLVNGAGLAMATMDTIKLFGAEPANFLDVGGGATPEKVTEAFKIMLKNDKVKAILVNIFGGIMKCDTIATGVITACKAVNLSVPLVVRMKGTNEELGKKMLAESGLPIISADSMAEAAQKVVAAVKG